MTDSKNGAAPGSTGASVNETVNVLPDHSGRATIVEAVALAACVAFPREALALLSGIGAGPEIFPDPLVRACAVAALLGQESDLSPEDHRAALALIDWAADLAEPMTWPDAERALRLIVEDNAATMLPGMCAWAGRWINNGGDPRFAWRELGKVFSLGGVADPFLRAERRAA